MKTRSKTNLALIDRLTDDEIDTTDIPPLDASFFANATVRLPARKTTITMRVDPDIVMWFKRQGKGYQSKMNAVLRLYVESQKTQVITKRKLRA